MNMSDQELREKDLSDIVGITDLPEAERDETLANIGELMLEGVLIRVFAEMSDEEVLACEKFLEADPDTVTTIEYLHSVVKDIEKYFDEEVLAFKRECMAVAERQRVAVAV